MSEFLPYGRQWIQDDDIESVLHALTSPYLTTGPTVKEFEFKLCESSGAGHAAAISNGTAALHAAMNAIGIGPGDEVIVPAMTFAASANSVLYQGGIPIFADVDPDTLLIDLNSVKSKISKRTKAIVAVDYAGQPCEYSELSQLASQSGAHLIADACHSLGATYGKQSVGTLADITTLSFHPVKIITTGEGGACLTNSAPLAESIRSFRNHGISLDHRERQEQNSWYYEIANLGYNYRLPDLLCALGISQLKKLNTWIKRRQQIAAAYDELFKGWDRVTPLVQKPGRTNAYHLYVVRLTGNAPSERRAKIFASLRQRGIGVNVHYLPVHLHPIYKQRFNYGAGLCPVAEDAYDRILSLPIFPQMTDQQVSRTVQALREAFDELD